ncbi:hypothetical protein [Niabella aquatica]
MEFKLPAITGKTGLKHQSKGTASGKALKKKAGFTPLLPGYIFLVLKWVADST